LQISIQIGALYSVGLAGTPALGTRRGAGGKWLILRAATEATDPYPGEPPALLSRIYYSCLMPFSSIQFEEGEAGAGTGPDAPGVKAEKAKGLGL
jgi:hypothetical protein